MLKARFDVSSVPLQGGYIAKQCPVRIQFDLLRPVEPALPSEEAVSRMREGVKFEEALVSELVEPEPGDWVVIDTNLPAPEAIDQTVAAMSSRAPVIFGGWLPADGTGRRKGKPDLLTLADDGYVPVDIKHHLTLDPLEDGVALTSSTVTPFTGAAVETTGWALRRYKDDALQLAHYRRMLQACGFAASSPRAGIIGKEGLVVWYDLDAPMWQTPAKSDGRKRKTRTSMEVYEFEFGFRLDIAAVTLRHLAGDPVELLVEPVLCGECGDCEWREHCLPILRSGSGDPSLIPNIGFREWRALRDAGITDRARLAELHYPTALLASGAVDVPFWLEAAAGTARDTPVAELRPRAKRQIEELGATGIFTAGDVLDAVDPLTAGISRTGFLPDAILRARAAIGSEPVYRRPGADCHVPRADIEIDIDMENVIDGVYLWGALVTDRARSGLVPTGYHSFVTWDPLDDSELANFKRFWEWLTRLWKTVEHAGLSVMAYCWHAPAENVQLNRMAALDEEPAGSIETFMTSEQWVDLMKVFDASWLTGGSSSLKNIAPLAGHVWEVDDPGGGMSMVRYLEATDPELTPADRDRARRWLLDYNRGDVEATLAVRERLDSVGSLVPAIEV